MRGTDTEAVCARRYGKTLNEDPRPGQRRKLNRRAEVILIATAWSQVLEGHAHWSSHLLAGKMVELAVINAISYQTLHRTRIKRNIAVADGNVVHSGGRCGMCGLYGDVLENFVTHTSDVLY